MTNYVRKMLADACVKGFTFVVRCDGEIDYKGTNPKDAYEAVDAVDEATVSMFDDAGQRAGWALIANDLAEDERIADCGGRWVDEWWKENIPL